MTSAGQLARATIKSELSQLRYKADAAHNNETIFVRHAFSPVR